MDELPHLADLYPEVVAEQRRNVLRFAAGYAASGAVFLLVMLFADGPVRLVGLLGLLGLVVCAVVATVLTYVLTGGRRVKFPRLT